MSRSAFLNPRLYALALIASLAAAAARAETPLPYLADPNLQNCLTEQATQNNWQYAEEVVQLACPGRGVVATAGIEALSNLAELDLSNNAIVDVWPLQNLHALTALNLSGNAGVQIGMLRPVLDGNWGLTRLGLNGIAVGPFSNLGALHNPQTGQPYALVELDLGNTGISDPNGAPRIDFLPLFPNLTRLNLAGNGLVEIHSLGTLTQLAELDLSDNAIVDVAPLQGLHTLTALDLSGNAGVRIGMLRPVLDQNWGLTRLGLNGIAVGAFPNLGALHNPQTGQPYALVELDLGNTGIADSTGTPRIDFLGLFPNLTRLNLAGNGIVEIQPLGMMTQLAELDLSDNAIVDVWPLQNLHALTALNLSGNVGVQIGMLRPVLDGNWGLTRLGLNGIAVGAFPNLGMLHNPQTGQPYALVELDLGNTGLTDPSGAPRIDFLGLFPNLVRLNLAGNGIVEIQGLGILTRLAELDLSDNAIVDVWPLQSLHALTALNLSGNTGVQIGMLRPVLDGNWGLTRLGLNGIAVGAFPNLGTLHNPQTGQPYALVELDLGNTGIADPVGQPRIDFLTLFPNLKRLNLAGNGIVEIQPLGQLARLAELDLSNNAIVDVWPLYNLKALTALNLSGNTEVPITALRPVLDQSWGLIRLGLNGIAVGPFPNLGTLHNPQTGQPYALVELDLGNTGLTDPSGAPRVDFLSLFPKLERLNLAGNGIVETPPFGVLTRLVELDLSNNAIVDVWPLHHLHALTALNLSGNAGVQIGMLRPVLDQNWGLTRLGLNGIAVGAFSNLGALHNPQTGQPYALVELDLGNTGITDPSGAPRIDFLGLFPKIERLNLAGNGIAELYPLGQLARLAQLDLSNNAIVDVWPLTSLQPVLRSLNLLDNDRIRCKDLDALEMALSETEIARPQDCVSDNLPPIADAGPPRSVNETAATTLQGSGYDPDGTIVAYQWTQVSGPTVALSGANSPQASFVAPWVVADTALVFQLSVTDDDGAVALASTSVTVRNLTGADLVATAATGSVTTVKRGTAFSFTVTIRNAGDRATGLSTTTGLYLSADRTISTADRLVGTVPIVAGFGAGASTTVVRSVTVPSTLAPGTYYLGAIADYTNRQAEISEANNSFAGATIVVTQ